MTTTITMPITNATLSGPRAVIAASAPSTPWVLCLPRNAHAAGASVPKSVNVVRVRMDAVPSMAAFSAVPAGIGSYAGRTQGSPPRGEPR